jgi:hypothetical protein
LEDKEILERCGEGLKLTGDYAQIIELGLAGVICGGDESMLRWGDVVACTAQQ